MNNDNQSPTGSTPDPDDRTCPAPHRTSRGSDEAGNEVRKPSPKEEEILRLTEIIGRLDLFHSKGNAEQAYARVTLRDKQEIVRIDSKRFRRGLTHLYRKEYGSYPFSSSIRTAVEGAAATAQFQCAGQPIYVRVGEHDGDIYIDLCDPEGRFIKIVPGKWDIVANCPIRFVRQPGMLPLPIPDRKGDIGLLWNCLGLGKCGRLEQCLIGSWMIQAFVPRGPFPLLWVTGPHGAGKSTFCRMARALIDPNIAPVRAIAQTERDLLIAATNSWIVGLDNISNLKDAMSDSMCRLATGAGFSARRLFTDGDEHLIYVKRPQMVNGIDDLALNSDLMDRGLFVTLQPIPADERRTEAELLAEFESKSPAIFGGLLDALSKALHDLPKVKPAKLPRMADFAKLAIAAERHLGFEEGTFEAAFQKNKESSDRIAVESSPVGLAIKSYMNDKRDEFHGTAEKLLTSIAGEARPEWLKSSDWPRLPRQLSVHLRRLAPNLEGVGIKVEFPQRTATARKLRLTRTATSHRPGA